MNAYERTLHAYVDNIHLIHDMYTVVYSPYSDIQNMLNLLPPLQTHTHRHNLSLSHTLSHSHTPTSPYPYPDPSP